MPPITKRLQNCCQDWWNVWYPKGREICRQYLKRRSRNVEYSAGCAFVCLVLIAIASVIIWATDKSSKAAKSAQTPAMAATPVSKLVHPAPQPSPAAFATPAPIRTEAEGRAEALRLYPALGVANSALNAEFVTRYNRYRQDRPEFFSDPAWPVKLVSECAADLREQSTPQTAK